MPLNRVRALKTIRADDFVRISEIVPFRSGGHAGPPLQSVPLNRVRALKTIRADDFVRISEIVPFRSGGHAGPPLQSVQPIKLFVGVDPCVDPFVC